MKLALAGMAIHLFFSSMTQGIILLNEDSNDTVMFWLVGSLAGIKWNQIMMILPCIVIAVIVTIFMGDSLQLWNSETTLQEALVNVLKL